MALDDAAQMADADLFEYDRQLPLDAQVVARWGNPPLNKLFKVTFRAGLQRTVTGFFALPPKYQEGTRIPCIHYVHGWNLYWGKYEDLCIDTIVVTTHFGYGCLLLDNPTFGEDFDPAVEPRRFAGPYATREWMMQTVVACRRGVDFLESRPEVDASRIGLWGGSLGGYIGSILGPVEERYRGVALWVPYLFRDYQRQTEGAGRWANSALFLPRLSPRPLLVGLGRDDNADNNRYVRELLNGLQEPKKLIIYPEGHRIEPKTYGPETLRWFAQEAFGAP